MNPCAEIAHAPSSSRTWLVAGLRIAVFFLAAALLIPLCLIAASPAQDTHSAPSFSISGVVKSGNSLIPGATVTENNTSTGKKVVTSTDINGAYSLQLSSTGKYEVRVEMTAFAAGTREVILEGPSAQADLAF